MRAGISLLAVLSVLAPNRAEGQGFLDSFSYEGLGLYGVGVEAGPVWSDRLTTEFSGGVRVDYGLIAPRVRVLVGGSFFNAELSDDEIAEFERTLQGVVVEPGATIDVGQITWANLQLDLDLQYLIPAGPSVLGFFGAGVGFHIRNGSGAAIEGTFVEDALDTVAAGAGLSAGIEVAAARQVHVTAELRGGLSSELRTFSARLGLMYRIRPWLTQ